MVKIGSFKSENSIQLKSRDRKLLFEIFISEIYITFESSLFFLKRVRQIICQ